MKNDYLEKIERVVSEYESGIEKQLNEQYVKEEKWFDRIADEITYFGGSWKFIVLFGAFLLLWIFLNTSNIFPHFDPAPYILLNLVLSFIAAFQAPIIMMSQNRQAARDKHESIIDYAINYKSEKEVANMQSHIHRIEKNLEEIKQMLAEKENRNN